MPSLSPSVRQGDERPPGSVARARGGGARALGRASDLRGLLMALAAVPPWGVPPPSAPWPCRAAEVPPSITLRRCPSPPFCTDTHTTTTMDTHTTMDTTTTMGTHTHTTMGTTGLRTTMVTTTASTRTTDA